MIEALNLNGKRLDFPLIQGGMGVGISLSSLAGNVMKQGCMGVISAAHPGYWKDSFRENSIQANCEAILEEVEKARIISEGKGILGINIMAASKDYVAYVKAAVKAKVDAIISGAGLPLDLPKYVEDPTILLAPIVSSAKAAQLICKAWIKRYMRVPDFMIIEGWEAGGHLGFKKEELLNQTCQSLETIFYEVKEILKPVEEEFKKRIPIFVAGGIFNGVDISKAFKFGADGVQIGTRFIATEECDANQEFKNQIIQCKKEDIQLIHSPSGFPGRAIKNEFFQRNTPETKISMNQCLQCLTPCTPQETPYCISEALIQSVKGNVNHGVVFVGSKGYLVNEMTTVQELITTLKQETELEMEKYK